MATCRKIEICRSLYYFEQERILMAGFRILIIEDDPEHADLIRMGFRRHDEFFLDFASSGEEGLRMIAATAYDLISVDLVLPGIGGLDVLVRIRKLDQDIPVVMVSGHGTTEMAVVAFENRATKYVVKSLESFKSLPYVFENLILEARFKGNERSMRGQIERSERIHRNIVENALAGIYILQEGGFKLVNPKLGEIFGCSAQSLLGLPFWQLVKPDDMHCVSILQRSASSDIPVYESRVQRRDGTCRWIEFRTVPIEYEGKRAMLGNLLDITERKEREIEIMQANRELAAIDGIMQICLGSSDDADKKLSEALDHLITGLQDAQIGGIFLREASGRGLELRALHGSVEDLIEFISGIESSILLVAPRVHRIEPDQNRKWISAPIAYSGGAKGAVVAACAETNGSQSLSFLEKAAGRIGYLLEACDRGNI
jgi:PAS domain S-box-containing protein